MINYYLLTKPGILFGNLITVTAGFLLASQGSFSFTLFLATLLGLTGIMASGCVFNNYIDRHIDQKMTRTQNRALAKGVISSQNAIIFACLLGMSGGAILLLYTNTLTFAIAAVGFFVYVVLYSLWKCRTVYGTAIGSIAGAVPPVIGYCAVSNHLDLGALILFVMMITWQMPHFFSIAVFRLEDYKAAAIPVLPVIKGLPQTKRRMVMYILAFVIISAMLSFFEYTGYFYLVASLSLGIFWLILGLRGYVTQNDRLWARSMFRFSLVVILTLSCIIPFDLIG